MTATTVYEAVAMDARISERKRTAPRISALLLHALPALMMDGRDHWPKKNLGLHRGENPRPKCYDNSPTRAKGMKLFEVDGMTIYAGTLGGARKKARLLKHFNA
jgi:hypothetical protein